MASTTERGIKGFNDILPGHQDAFLDSRRWQHMQAVSAEVLAAYGYEPVGLPLLESASLFVRGLGEATDVIAKEMYTLVDRGDRLLALRPEGTAGAVRAYLEHQYVRNSPQQRWYYLGPMFRAERPQKGRYRQFYQLGAEQFGSPGPGSDVDLILMLQALARALGLPPLRVNINTLGDEPSRTAYRSALSSYLMQHEAALCEACRRRLATNPLRVLDCKEPACRPIVAEAPDLLASLNERSASWFADYRRLLDAAQVAYQRNPRLVRGLDYYSDAIFELTTDQLGAQDAVFGGGRYDGLVSALGGPPTPAVGFAAGIERILLLLGDGAMGPKRPALVLSAADDESVAEVLQLAEAVRRAGIAVIAQADVARPKVALKRAARLDATHFLAIGATERAARSAQLKHLGSGEMVDVTLTADALARALISSASKTPATEQPSETA